MKTTKRALFSSVMALILCFSMLVGTTFAWFTDEVKSDVNKIVAGNLDVNLYHSDAAVKDKPVDPDTKLFDDVDPLLWEPGALAYEILTVANEGTLALKYQLSINFENASYVNGKTLADALKVAVVDATELTSREAAIAAAEGKWQALASFDLRGELEAKKTETYGVVIYWEPTDNDNDFNVKDGALHIDLGVHLFATQLAAEEDSFGDDYDGDALACDVVATPETIAEILATVEPGTIIGLAAGEYGIITLTQNNLTLVSNSAVVGQLDLNEMDGITVDGLTFNAATAVVAYNAGGAASEFVANLTDGKANNGGSVGVVIKNCEFTGIAADSDKYIPVYFGDSGRGNRSDDIVIENCVFQTNAKQYIALNGVTNNSGKTVGEIVIKNNVFGGNGFGTSHNTIQATGQGCDWTITGNKFYNWNIEKTAIGSSRNGNDIITWDVIGNEFYHEDGAVVMALKTSYTDANTVITFADNTAMMGYAALVATPVNGENEPVYGAMKIEMETPVVFAESVEDIRTALEQNGVVIMEQDVTASAVKGGYSKTGVIVSGDVLDGNGNTLTVNNAGGTWDCAVYATNGTIKNLTINSGFRGIFMAGASGDVIIDNVIIDGPVYTFNSDDGNKAYGVYISNSTLNGWTSHSDVHKEVVYTNCEFGEGSGYAFCRPYGPTTFVGCNFSEGYKIDARGLVVFENCTINDVALTAENLATLVTGGIANATVR